ncbi:hypothetical protein O6H91_23G018200 [Diphasiastrum complanatum]|uniref:Uncharacterized protein n=1 Tax=Diphasiastrum complanatum TaxID=34168 RepID=A0ACC2A8N0_DIPCM|nr:hypothetical protein O6H91_Y581300 [Diphasiastrum complanatum]KAJ7513882.1 hypothetical protein O6H91_23G018200 [Diphasiastrum complanatum]
MTGPQQQEGVVDGQPAIGIPYAYPPPPQANGGYPYGSAPPVMAPPQQQGPPQHFYTAQNYLPNRGPGPFNAIYGHPNGIPLRETFYGDTPAPFECPYCSTSGLTNIKSKPSIAACVACLVSMVGICFLCPSCDCLWNKEHYCPNCGNKVEDFKKSDPCMVFDGVKWVEPSYAIPA